MSDCEHRSQRARLDPDSDRPFTYYCCACGEVTSREAKPFPLWGIPYYRTESSGEWMGLGRVDRATYRHAEETSENA